MALTKGLFLLFYCMTLTHSQDLQSDISQLIFPSGFDLGNRGSFDVIVTPEPQEPNAQTFVPIRNSGNTCKCVVYHECDAENSPQSTLTNRVEIDLDRNPNAVCPETLDVCCRNSPVVTQRPTEPTIVPMARPPFTEAPPPAPVLACGTRNIGGLDFTLVNDFNNEAGYGEFPWTGALMQKEDSKYICGASLIHFSVALTSNHCTKFVIQRGTFTRTLQSETQPASYFKVRFGEWDTQTTKERWPYQERSIQSIVGHPSYSSKSLANDVALLILEKPIDPVAHINVVCLPPVNFVADSPDCFSNGWGKNEFGSQYSISSILKKVPLGMVESNTCQSKLRATRLGNRFRLDPTFVCAGGVKGTDTCTGDGGAPLVCPIGPTEENRYVQVGSVAWGIGCKDDIPGVYSNIASFRSWIDTVMTNLGLGTNSYTY